VHQPQENQYRGLRFMFTPETWVGDVGGAENAGHEIAGHAKAKQKTSSEAANVRVCIDCVVFYAYSCSDSRIVEDQSRFGLSHRLEHTRNSLINVTPASTKKACIVTLSFSLM